MEPTNNQMLLIISIFTLNLFNPAQSIDISSAPSDVPSSQPVSSPSPFNVRDFQPVSRPSSRPNIASKPIEYVTFQLPLSWSSKKKLHRSTSQSSAPSPSPNPSTEGSSAVHHSQMLTQSLSADHFSHQIKRDSAAASATNPEIKKICDTTDHPALCVPFITPFFAAKSDTYSVLELAMKASALQIRKATAAIAKLASVREMQLEKRSKLEDCKESYDDALENLQNAMDAVPNRDIGTISSMLSAAVTDFSDCDDFTANSPPVANYDDKLTKLVSNCLAIAATIN